jgi:hypothetical protein
MVSGPQSIISDVSVHAAGVGGFGELAAFRFSSSVRAGRSRAICYAFLGFGWRYAGVEQFAGSKRAFVHDFVYERSDAGPGRIYAAGGRVGNGIDCYNPAEWLCGESADRCVADPAFGGYR